MRKSIKLSIIAVLCIFLIASYATAVSVKTPIGINEAEKNAAAFLENPNIQLKYEYEYKSDSGSSYVFSTGNGQVYVNMYTGTVERATFYDAKKSSESVAIDMDQAEKIAREYAIKKYEGFDNMNMLLIESELLNHGDGGYEYSFVYREMIDDVFSPNAVVINLNANSGDVMSYMSKHNEIVIDTKSKISREDAIISAKAVFPKKDLKVNDSYLSIEYTKPEVQSLIWVVILEGESVDDMLYGGVVVVDAISGDVILVSPYC